MASQEANPLLGAWAVVWSQTNGQPKRRQRSIHAFSESAFLVVGDDRSTSFSYTIDPTAEPPHLDWFPAIEGVRIPSRAIYAIEGDALTLCTTRLGMPRPTEFATEAGDMRTLTVFQKIETGPGAKTPGELHEVLLREFGPAPAEEPFEEPEFDRAARERILQIFLDITDRPGAEDYDSLYRDVLTDKERAVFNIEWLITEVDNGGLHQFFRNPIGNNALDIVGQLEAIGAFETAETLRRACGLFREGGPAADQAARHEQLDAFTLDQVEELENLDTRFYRRQEDLRKLLLRYWGE